MKASDSVCVKGWDTDNSEVEGEIFIWWFEIIRLYTEVIKSLMRSNIHSCRATVSAESRGATNEVVLMCDIHLHEILMRAEFCCLYNEGCSSKTAGQPLQLVKL